MNASITDTALDLGPFALDLEFEFEGGDNPTALEFQTSDYSEFLFSSRGKSGARRDA